MSTVVRERAELIRIRFSAMRAGLLREQAETLKKPLASVVRAFCRMPLSEGDLTELLAGDDVRPGREKDAKRRSLSRRGGGRRGPSATIRIRFSALQAGLIRDRAKRIKRSIAAVIRAFCRAPSLESDLAKALASDDVKRGVLQGQRLGRRAS